MSLTFHNKRRREAAKKAVKAAKEPARVVDTPASSKPVKKAVKSK